MRVHLHRRLTLEAVVRTPDGAGGFGESWQPLGIVWAEILPGRGRDVGRVEVSVAATACRITLRAAPPGAVARPVPGHRLRDAGRIFRILAVTERDRHGQYLTCFAEEEQP